MRKLGETDIAKKTIALRVDLNVPIKNENVLDDTRILAILPTLEYLEKKAAKVLLLSHFGRPEPGKFNADFSLRPVGKRLAELLGKQIPFFKSLEDVNFDTIVKIASNQHMFPNIDWEDAPVRVYNYKGMFSHVIGYIGSISKDEYRLQKKAGYKYYQKIGKNGIENVNYFSKYNGTYVNL